MDIGSLWNAGSMSSMAGMAANNASASRLEGTLKTGYENASISLVDYYKEQMIQQVAADTTEQNSLGLAQMLFEQMKRNMV